MIRLLRESFIQKGTANKLVVIVSNITPLPQEPIELMKPF